MKIYRFILLILIPLLLTCKKGEQWVYTKIEGTVKDAETGKPIENANITIVRENEGDFVPHRMDSIVATSNSDGKYSFNFRAYRESNYIIKFEKLPYYLHYEPPVLITKKTTNTIDAKLYGKAYLKLRIKNTNPFDDNDSFSMLPKIFLNGRNVDTIFYFDQFGSGLIYSTAKIKKNNIVTEIKNEFYLSTLDTAYYEWDY